MLRPVSSLRSISGTSTGLLCNDLSLHLSGNGTKRIEPSAANILSGPGRSFATQDYLALGTHPAIRAAVLAAPDTASVTVLESRIARFLHLPAAVAFSSASEAIRIVLLTVLRPGDHVIADSGAHSAVFETVLSTHAHLHRSPAGSVEAVERRLVRLSRQPRTGRIFLVVPAISAHASRMADLAELSALARAHGAVLVADVTHDLGSMGQSGGGIMEIQGCTGRVDIVLGSFAKSFGAPGGFAAFRDPSLTDALRQGPWRMAPLSPDNASVILAALDIIESLEGRRRRRQLHGNALRLRNHLMADGVRVMGQASPFVVVRLPLASALARTALLESAGPIVNLLQAPVVAGHAPRWRILLNSGHGAADIDDLAELIRDVTRTFDRQPRLVHRVEPAPQT